MQRVWLVDGSSPEVREYHARRIHVFSFLVLANLREGTGCAGGSLEKNAAGMHGAEQPCHMFAAKKGSRSLDS